ncbi:MAG: c-type cytochrome, partial [Tepidisphaeraceae bacterium]
METRPPHSAALVLLGMAALAIVTGVAPTTAPIDVAPGLMLSIESGATRDARVARLAALRVPQDAAPTPLVPPGPFRATFSGYINLKIRGQYSFGATGRGTVKVMVNDAVALDARGDFAGVPGAPVKLTKGKNRILIEYAGPKSGDAELRLLWSSKEFPPEPVSPAFLTHDANDALLVRQTAVRAGRELFAHLRCIKCHVADDKPGPSAMPELSADAPDLTDVGARVNRDWMAAWIENPRAIRPDSSMPRVVSSPQQAADVAAYLATPGTSGESVAGNGDANAGARLFLSLGCIACHAAPDAATIDREHQRIPLGFVRAKYNPAALAQYLARPDAHYSWTRMPDFHLSGDEVSALCAYLLARCPPDVVPSVVAGDPARGKTLFQQAGCLNCHSGPGASQHKSPPLAELKPSHGCLTENPDQRAAAPDFALNTSQRDALKQFLASDRSALNRDDRGEFALRQIAALRCTACHTLDSRPDTWSGLTDQIAAIESQLPPVKDDQQQYAPDQTLPILTWTGEKLRV